MKIRKQQFNDPQTYNLGNLHIVTTGMEQAVPKNSQCADKMKDLRLNAELARLRMFKKVSGETRCFSEFISKVLDAKIQDRPLVLYFLDQIKNVIEIGRVFTRDHLEKIKEACDVID